MYIPYLYQYLCQDLDQYLCKYLDQYLYPYHRDPPIYPGDPPCTCHGQFRGQAHGWRGTNSMCRLRLGEQVDSETGPADQQVLRMLRTVPFRSTVVRSVQLIQTRQRTGPRILG